MRYLVSILLAMCRVAFAFPRLTLAGFGVATLAGLATIPFTTVSPNLTSGVGSQNPVIRLAEENNTVFGEQDSVIIVLEFPEPPDENRLAFIEAIARDVARLPDVRRVRHRFVRLEDRREIGWLLKHFLLGMNERESEALQSIFTPDGVKAAFRRNIHRLFLTANPYLEARILEDPLDLGRFVAYSMQRRVGSLSLGDAYLLLASPDSTVYLIQVTPEFFSPDIGRGQALVDRLRRTIPESLARFIETIPDHGRTYHDVQWFLTGKTLFNIESNERVSREATLIVGTSLCLVLTLLVVVFRSLNAGLILMVPILAGVAPNSGVSFLVYDELNPVVLGATAVLVGLGTDFGVHLWSRFNDEVDRGCTAAVALVTTVRETGPPLVLGGSASTLAFLCLCFSSQPAMGQFGFVGASGLFLNLVAAFFLFPALVAILSARPVPWYPRMRVKLALFSRLYRHRPGVVLAVSAVSVVIAVGFALGTRYEKDLFKVFLTRGVASFGVSERISRKFNANFSQPTLLSFEAENLEEGLRIQRLVDKTLLKLMDTDREIASFDSISYLMAPESVISENIKAISGATADWASLAEVFRAEVNRSPLSVRAGESMTRSFEVLGRVVADVADRGTAALSGDPTQLERSWYMTRISGKYRFLTRVRYSNAVLDPTELTAADRRMGDALQTIPVPVSATGPRQVMHEILSSLVSELFRLGAYGVVCVVVVLLTVFRHPLGALASLIPMAGALAVTLGVIGALGMGLPFSIVAVGPLIFGLGIDSGVHVVTASMMEAGGSVAAAMDRLTRPIFFTSLANMLGFVAMVLSSHYAVEFLGIAMVVGMVTCLALTLTTLPSLLLLVEQRRNQRVRERGRMAESV